MSGVESASRGRRAVEQPDLEGVRTDTRPMWAIAVLPLVTVLFPAQPAVPVSEGTLSAVIADGLPVALILGLVVVEVLLAVADRRILVGRGIIRPMHPAWAILDPVYVIGRAVVVRRRVRGSLNPLWVWIGATIVAYALNSIPR